MGVTFEQTEFLSSFTSPYIPYTVYIKESYLLLIPRQVAHVHPMFPPMRDPLPRITIHLTDKTINEHKERYGREPFFSARKVHFGLEEDEVVVAALLLDSGEIQHWEFRTLMTGENIQFTSTSSHPNDSFGLLQWDLAQAAGPPPSDRPSGGEAM